MIKKLPINLNSNYISECWTYYKCCILDTFLEGQKWMTLNLEVYMDGNNSVFWGEEGTIYPLEHFDSILKISPIELKKSSEDKIVSLIKKNIIYGNYIIVDCDISKISLSASDKSNIHEILIYGYDEEKKVFFSPLLDNNTGRCAVVEIPYEKFILAYKEARKKYITDANYRYNRRYYYFYPITRIKPHKNKMNESEFLFSFVRKLNDEIRNEKRVIITMDEKCDISGSRDIYKGLGCTTRIKCVVEGFLNLPIEQKWNIDLTQSLLKLYEYKENLLIGVSIIFNDIFPEQIDHRLFDDYIKVVQLYKKAYLLSYKYSHTKNEINLKSLCKIIAQIMEMESSILKDISKEITGKMRLLYEHN